MTFWTSYRQGEPKRSKFPRLKDFGAFLFRTDVLWKRVIRWTVFLIALWVLSTGGLVLMLRFVNPPVWAWRMHRVVAPPAESNPKVRHEWVGLERISPQMQLAVIAAEDQLFAAHHGFDWEAIFAAIDYNQEGDRTRGGSTITQQTAKNLFLYPARSYIRKGIEAYFTFLLELLWPKTRILEVYLNIVEFGPNLYGVEAAAHVFFGRSALDLSRTQASRLAAALPNPHRYRIQPPSGYVVRRSAWIRQQMRQLGQATLNEVSLN